MWHWRVYAICQGEKVRVVWVESGAVARGEGDQINQIKGRGFDTNNKQIGTYVIKNSWLATLIKPKTERIMPTARIKDKWASDISLTIDKKNIIHKIKDLLIAANKLPANLTDDKNPIIDQIGFKLAIKVDKIGWLIGKIRDGVGSFEVEFIKWGEWID